MPERTCVALFYCQCHSPANDCLLQAGKGRTGLIASAYFLFCGLFTNADRSMLFFANRRSTNNYGVTQPGQRRYDDALERSLPMHRRMLLTLCCA
jgi:hypothetical protein